ncbi:MAG: hypothetical protein AAF678_12250 [Pseudomonadota bacterium]
MLDLLGPRLAHVTAQSNVPSICATGLKCVADLARDAHLSADEFLLRTRRQMIGPATLNHQRPLANYHATAARLLEDHTPKSWAAQLDRRVFFWTATEAAAFSASISRDLPIVTLWFDTRILIEALAPFIDICPLNSGSFRQGGGGKPRGNWIYVPVTSGVEAYRRNRQRHTDLGNPDSKIREVSCRTALPAQLVRRALLQEMT